ncbi:hypothetical protein HZS_1219, partial [Henneguya salminicola]
MPTDRKNINVEVYLNKMPSAPTHNLSWDIKPNSYPEKVQEQSKKSIEEKIKFKTINPETLCKFISSTEKIYIFELRPMRFYEKNRIDHPNSINFNTDVTVYNNMAVWSDNLRKINDTSKSVILVLSEENHSNITFSDLESKMLHKFNKLLHHSNSFKNIYLLSESFERFFMTYPLSCFNSNADTTMRPNPTNIKSSFSAKKLNTTPISLDQKVVSNLKKQQTDVSGNRWEQCVRDSTVSKTSKIELVNYEDQIIKYDDSGMAKTHRNINGNIFPMSTELKQNNETYPKNDTLPSIHTSFFGFDHNCPTNKISHVSLSTNNDTAHAEEQSNISVSNHSLDKNLISNSIFNQDSKFTEKKLDINSSIPPSPPQIELDNFDRNLKPIAEDTAENKSLGPSIRVTQMLRNDSQPYMVGLTNTNLICYMNSVIQSLVSIEQYRVLIDQVYSLSKNGVTISSLISTLHWYQSEIVSGKFFSLSMEKMEKVIFERMPHFIRGVQQDAHEFLLLLISCIEDDIKLIDKEILEIPKLPERPTPLDLVKQYDTLFYGAIRHKISCNSCGSASYQNEKFNHITVALSGDEASTYDGEDLDSCLNRYFSIEQLPISDEWKCSNCKCIREATKTPFIERLPLLLIIHLSRYCNAGKKIQSLIKYPMDKLNFSFRLSIEFKKEYKISPTYNLVSVVHHHGLTITSGHYVASCKRPVPTSINPSWLRCDDFRVEQILNPEDSVV